MIKMIVIVITIIIRRRIKEKKEEEEEQEKCMDNVKFCIDQRGKKLIRSGWSLHALHIHISRWDSSFQLHVCL